MSSFKRIDEYLFCFLMLSFILPISSTEDFKNNTVVPSQPEPQPNIDLSSVKSSTAKALNSTITILPLSKSTVHTPEKTTTKSYSSSLLTETTSSLNKLSAPPTTTPTTLQPLITSKLIKNTTRIDQIEHTPNTNDSVNPAKNTTEPTYSTINTPSSYSVTTFVPTTTTTLTTILVKRVEDYHRYYKSMVLKGVMGQWWVDEGLMYQADKHHTLSESYRSAATISLRFPFTFYGHVVTQVTIATGGFLYMSDFLHQWLTATQYIAPLMANFDTQIGNDSHIRFFDDGKMFVVWWENIHLQDETSGHYSFQAQLHANGTVVFCYKDLPIKNPTSMPSNRHPVKVGLSDAYYMDKPTNTDLKQRTIYEYHRVEINMSLIETNTTVIITPLPTCVQIKTCAACVAARVEQACQWCSALQYCSDGMDRKRQEWLHYGCNKQFVSRREQCQLLETWQRSMVAGLASANAVAFLLLMMIFAICFSCLVAWLVYAYRHPSSRSGIWLIEHHPALIKGRVQQLFARLGKNLNSSKYRVAMQPEVESLAQM